MTVRRTLRAWLEGFSECVRDRDFERGKQYFDPRASCFGSRATRCEGLDDLVKRQWQQVWPRTSGFRFDLERMKVSAGTDQRWICGMVTWRSTGHGPHGRRFLRKGRMTVVLTTRGRTGRWRAVHTHYSLNPS